MNIVNPLMLKRIYLLTIASLFFGNFDKQFFMRKSILYLALFLVIFSSCVTPKIHNALISENEAIQSELTTYERKALNLQSELEEFQEEIKTLKTSITNLRNDSTQNGKTLIVLQKKYDALNDSYDLLTSKNSREMANKAKETKLLLEQLEEVQSSLFSKEDELSNLSLSLEAKEEELKLAQEMLDLRSIRVTELESIINKKDSILTSLKKSISKALIGL